MHAEAEKVVVSVLIRKPLEIVWNSWMQPEDIRQWNVPFNDWHCPQAENDPEEGGRFFYRVERKDGKEGFDHTGIYDKIVPYQLIEYTLDDGRRSSIEFQHIDQNTIVRESFDPEERTPVSLQKEFCQAVLDRFREYVEAK